MTLQTGWFSAGPQGTLNILQGKVSLHTNSICSSEYSGFHSFHPHAGNPNVTPMCFAAGHPMVPLLRFLVYHVFFIKYIMCIQLLVRGLSLSESTVQPTIEATLLTSKYSESPPNVKFGDFSGYKKPWKILLTPAKHVVQRSKDLSITLKRTYFAPLGQHPQKKHRKPTSH